MKTLLVIVRLVISVFLPVLFLAGAGWLVMILMDYMDPEMRPFALVALVSGMWTILCLGIGVVIGRSVSGFPMSPSSLPPINPDKMFQWIRTGKTDETQDETDSVEERPPVGYSL
jgi:hypothetical protein